MFILKKSVFDHIDEVSNMILQELSGLFGSLFFSAWEISFSSAISSGMECFPQSRIPEAGATVLKVSRNSWRMGFCVD